MGGAYGAAPGGTGACGGAGGARASPLVHACRDKCPPRVSPEATAPLRARRTGVQRGGARALHAAAVLFACLLLPRGSRAQFLTTWFAGAGTTGTHVDGPLLTATFSGSYLSMAVAPNSTLYIGDGPAIRAVAYGASVTTTVAYNASLIFYGICVDPNNAKVYAIGIYSGTLCGLYEIRAGATVNGTMRTIVTGLVNAMACAVDNNGNVLVAVLASQLVRINPANGALTNLLNGTAASSYMTGTSPASAFSQVTYCVDVERTSGDILFCDNAPVTTVAGIRRINATSSAITTVFNTSAPVNIAVGPNFWFVAATSGNSWNMWTVATNSVSYPTMANNVGKPNYIRGLAADVNTGVFYCSTPNAIWLMSPLAPAPPPAAPPPPAPPGIMSGALTVCGSSSQSSAGTPASSAVDANLATEWVSALNATANLLPVGSWLCINLPSGITQLTFWQRQTANVLNDVILTASLAFSDGSNSTLAFGNYSIAAALKPVTVPVSGTPSQVNITITRVMGIANTGGIAAAGNVGFSQITALMMASPPPRCVPTVPRVALEAH